MLNRMLLLCGAFSVCAVLGAPQSFAAESPAKTLGKADALIAAYRGSTNVAEKLKSLRALGPLRTPAVDQVLEQEFSKLDATREPGARLAGGILTVWAQKQTKDVLPYLLYEGLFHEDADVVRACADGIGQMPEVARALMSTGRAAGAPALGEDLATDLLKRMHERSDVMHAMERVLVIWTGKKRPGYQADIRLKDKPADDARAAALAFWTTWYEERFRKKLKL